MKLLIYTANLGNFDKVQRHVEQELPEGINSIEYWRCTDDDYPPRINAMTPRLQARIVKMFGWQFKPDFDYYLWVDSSHRLHKPDLAKFFVDKLWNSDVAVFEHPDRKTIQDEANYLYERLQLEAMGKKKQYIIPRYENEDIDGILREVDPSAPLYATTAYIYRNTPEVQKALKEWWYTTSRFHSIDQLGFTDAFKDLRIATIREKYFEVMESIR